MTTLTQPGRGVGMTLLYLLTAGGALAVTVLISAEAARADAPMMWFLTAILAASGLIQLAIAGALGLLRGWWRFLPYSLGAAVFLAAPTGLGYLAVRHVGAGYISLTFAFPILLTWGLARLMGLEKSSRPRAFAVALGLVGGVILAWGKLGQGVGGAPLAWLGLATALPLVIAGGNIYRSRFWPAGATPAALSALMLLLGAAIILPFALLGGHDPVPLATDPHLRLLLVTDIAVFVVQYLAYFALQKTGGPVTLSLIGPVAAVIGAAAARALFGEALPDGLAVAAALIGAGTVLMLWRKRPQQGSSQASMIATASSAVST